MHKMTIFSKNLWRGHGPFGPHGYAYAGGSPLAAAMICNCSEFHAERNIAQKWNALMCIWFEISVIYSLTLSNYDKTIYVSFPRKRPAKKTISSSSVFSTIDAFLQIRMEIFTDKTPSIVSIETLFSVAVSWTTLSHKVHLFPKYSFWVTSYEQTEELLAKQIQTRKGRTTVQAITLTLEKIVEFYATKGQQSEVAHPSIVFVQYCSCLYQTGVITHCIKKVIITPSLFKQLNGCEHKISQKMTKEQSVLDIE